MTFENSPSPWGISTLPNGRIKSTGRIVVFIDGRRAWPWRRIKVGQLHHITARNRRTSRDLWRVARGHADRLKVALSASFPSHRAEEANLVTWTPPDVGSCTVALTADALTADQVAAIHASANKPAPADYWDRPNRWVSFTPVRRDDVRPEAALWIDSDPFEVEFIGTMDEGLYDGQTMWMPVRDQPGPRVGWLPDCDLTDAPRTEEQP